MRGGDSEGPLGTLSGLCSLPYCFLTNDGSGFVLSLDPTTLYRFAVGPINKLIKSQILKLRDKIFLPLPSSLFFLRPPASLSLSAIESDEAKTGLEFAM